MSTPPTIDDPNRAPEGADDRDWARWEQTFRDARPVLPEAAMQRIDQAIKIEVQRAAPSATHSRRWLLLIAAAAIVVAVATWVLNGRFEFHSSAGVAPIVEERFPLTFPSGPRRVGPTTSALPLAEERQAVIVAASKSVDQGIVTYRGPVTLSIGSARIACGVVTVFRGPDVQSRLLSGKGAVHGENVLPIGTISADEFTFNTATGTISFTGNVHASINGRPTRSSSLTITSDGKVEATPN